MAANLEDQLIDKVRALPHKQQLGALGLLDTPKVRRTGCAEAGARLD